MAKKKMPPVEQAGDKKTTDIGEISYKDYTKNQSEKQVNYGPVAALLLREGATSEAEKMTAEEVKTMLGLSDVRRVQQMVEQEREIAAILTTSRNGGGMWLADPGTEEGQRSISRCAQTILNRGARTIATGRRLKRLIKDLPGQYEIVEGN